MLEREKYILAGVLGILAFVWWWWKSRHGKWFYWGDLFAALLLTGWLIVCFGTIHWEFGYMGQVTDACGHPIAYASVHALGAPLDLKLPKIYDAPLPRGAYRTDIEGRYQVKGRLRWSKPFERTPLVWPKIGVDWVHVPQVATTFIQRSEATKLSLRVIVDLEKMDTKTKTEKFYYPRSLEGLSQEEKTELIAAAKLYQHRVKTKTLDKDGRDSWCEFMALWTHLLTQVGPQPLCKLIADEDLSKHLGPQVATLCR